MANTTIRSKILNVLEKVEDKNQRFITLEIDDFKGMRGKIVDVRNQTIFYISFMEYLNSYPKLHKSSMKRYRLYYGPDEGTLKTCWTNEQNYLVSVVRRNLRKAVAEWKTTTN